VRHTFRLLIVAVVVEMLLYMGAPNVYSLAARIPFGPTRRLVVHRHARRGLPPTLDIGGLVLHFVLERGFALARNSYSFTRKVVALVRVDIVPVDGALELRPRFVIVGWPSFFIVGPIAVVEIAATEPASQWFGAFAIGALFFGITVVVGLIAGRSQLERGVSAIESQIRAALTSAEDGD
jgi:hypothetical protein